MSSLFPVAVVELKICPLSVRAKELPLHPSLLFDGYVVVFDWFVLFFGS